MNTSRFIAWSFSASVLAALGCESGPVKDTRPAPESPAAAPKTTASQAAPSQVAPGASASAGVVSRYGAALQPGPEVALTALLADPKAYADQTVTTQGKVQRACS